MPNDFLAELEDKYQLPSGLLNAVMKQESDGNVNAISPKGAKGAFQFMPNTAKQYGVDTSSLESSAEGAAKMYSDLLKASNGDLDKALASYNWGFGKVSKFGLDKAPKETRDYIVKVKANMPNKTINPDEVIWDNEIINPKEVIWDNPVKKPELSDAAKTEQSLNAAAFGLPIGTFSRSMLHNAKKTGTGLVELGGLIGSRAVEDASLFPFNMNSNSKLFDPERKLNQESNPVSRAINADERQYQQEVPDSPASIGGAIAGSILPFTFNPIKSGMNATYEAAKMPFIRQLPNSPRIASLLGNISGGVATGAAITPMIPSGVDTGYFPEKLNQLKSNMLTGGLVSGAIPAVTGLGSWLGNKFSGVSDLFKGKQGAENIANRYINSKVGQVDRPTIMNAVKNAPEYVAGSTPTTSEAISNLPSGSALQELQNIVSKESTINPYTGSGISTDFGKRIVNQQSARQSALSWAGTQDDISKLVKDRTDTVKPLYDAVEKSTAQVKSSPVLTKVNNILNLNKNKSSVAIPLNQIRDALVIKTDTGVRIESNPQSLKSLSDELSDMMGKKTVDGKNEYDVKVLSEIKDLLDEQISKAVPDYAKALSVFKEKSIPINQLKIGQQLRDKLTNALGTETPGTFVRTLDNEKKLLKDSIGFGRTSVEDILTPEQLQSINSVASDLERKSASLHPLQKTDLRGGVKVANETTISLPNLLSRPAMFTNYVLKTLGNNIEPEIDAYMAKLFLNPQELGKMLSKVEPSKRAAVNSVLQTFGRAYVANKQQKEQQ